MSETVTNYDFMELGQAIMKARELSVDQYIHPDSPTEKITLRRQLDALFDTFDDSELTIIAGTAQGICKAKEQPED